MPFFGRGLVGGIWLALIGMFLRNAAVQHYVGSAVHDALEGVRSRDLMRTRGAWVEASTPLRVLVDGWFSKTDGDSFPVFDQGRFVGFVSIDGIRTVPVSEWDTRTARDIMVPVERLAVGSPDEPVYEALRRLGAADLRQLPIVENGALVGILNEQDIGRFVDLTAARRGRPAPRPRHA